MTAFQAGAGYGDDRPEEARGPAAVVLDHSHPASKRIIVGYGFWIFLLSDIVMFSAFFALVGCHGVHVTLGLLWLLTMMAQVFAKGYRHDILRRVLCFALFWHTLDIIWVAIFTVVYLLGAG